MILILTSRTDKSTVDVLNWLWSKGVSFIRISEESNLQIEEMRMEDGEVEFIFTYEDYDGTAKSFRLSDISSYWYRRSHLLFNRKNLLLLDELTDDKNLTHALKAFANSEQKEFVQFIFSYLDKIHSLGNYRDNDTNKLFNLYIAEKCGLKTPLTYYTSDKNKFKEFVNATNKQLITKGLGNNWIQINDIAATGMTEKVDHEIVENKEYGYAFVQEQIEKLFELRIFYMKNKCYSSAIFSQNNKKTSVDFRNYDTEVPNRIVPYILPKSIAEKVNLFMDSIHMSTGSLDILVSKEGEYIFLEVNPVGQFAQVSYPCNFNIEEKIANYLIN